MTIPHADWASLPKARAGCRETRSSGSVEGVVGNHDPYSDFLNYLLQLRCIEFGAGEIGGGAV